MGALEDAIATGNFQQAGELSSFFSQPTVGAGDIGLSQGQPFVSDPQKRAALAMILARGGLQQQQEQAAQKRFIDLLTVLKGNEDAQSALLGRAGFKMPKISSDLMKRVLLTQLQHALGAPEREERLRLSREGLEERKAGRKESQEFRESQAAATQEARGESLALRRETAASQEEDRIFKNLRLLEELQPGSARQILQANPEIMKRLIARALQESGETGKATGKARAKVRRVE